MKLTPDGHIRVFAFDAAVESTGMIVTRPETCSGSSSWIRRSAATWPSYSSPWLPARTSTFGPSPFATDAIGMKVLAQPPVLRDLRQLQPADLLARTPRGRSCRRPGDAVTARGERRGDRGLGRLEQPIDVLVGVRVREVAPLQVQRQLEDPVPHQLAPVADEEVDVVPEQVVVALHRPLEEVGDEDRAEAGDDDRHAEPRVERAQPLARALAEPEDVLVHRLALELVERRERRRGRGRDAR